MLSKSIMIYQLLDSKRSGGIETHVAKLSLWLKQQGYLCEVIFCRDYGDHPLKQQLKDAGITYSCLDNMASLVNFIRKQPSILATHGYKAGILGRIIGKLCGTAVVSTYHSGDIGKGKLKCYSLIDDFSAFLANQVISVSPDIRSRIRSKSSYIPNFINEYHPIFEKYRLPGEQIAFVGRLSEEKGPDIFCNISKELLHKEHQHNIKRYNFNCYGDGMELKKLKALHHHVAFHGQCDMNEHWSNIGVLCITSRFEGLPFVALEAMARGIPVISFAIGAMDELIDHNKNGWLVSPSDNQGFIERIIQWRNLSSIQKQALADSAKKKIAKSYSCNTVLPNILETYQQALLQVAKRVSI